MHGQDSVQFLRRILTMKQNSLRTILIFFFSFILSVNAEEKPYVLLVSFDGFRADYLDWYDTPNFDALAERGVKAESLQPQFPTKTFPNHYSIVTGMYIENHGLIANSFYDQRLDLEFTLRNRDRVQDARFYGGEPIWVTAENQGIKTASYFWVGTEAPIGDVYPGIWKLYDMDVPFQARIDSVVSWFSLPEDRRPQFITLYFHEPDWTGHSKGPKDRKTRKKVEEMDSVLGDLIEALSDLIISEQLNIIITSDHGMVEVRSKNAIYVNKYVDMKKVSMEGRGPFSFIYGKDREALNEAYATLKNVKHISVYKKDEIPERYHYRDHYRIKDILIVADEGWTIRKDRKDFSGSFIFGDHGYDNTLQSMQAIFLGDGPAFKDGYERSTVENIHIYPLIAEILGIIPNENIDGNLEKISDVLIEN